MTTKAKSKGARKAAKRVSAKIRAKGVSLSPGGKERLQRAREGHTRGDTFDVGPTPERLAKDDIIVNKIGVPVVEDVLVRLHRTGRLDPDEVVSWKLKSIGGEYQTVVQRAGLTGIGAQDLSRLHGGNNEPAYLLPASHVAMVARERFRKAWSVLGPVAPTVHGMLVEGMSACEAGRKYQWYAGEKQAEAAAIVAFRLGLCQLAREWA